MPDIFATQPVVIPPQPEVVFDRWIIQDVSIRWPSTTGPMPMEVAFRVAKRENNGNLTVGKTVRRMTVDDLWALAATDAGVAAALNSFVEQVTRVATERGLI